jgi:hypothetical protein
MSNISLNSNEIGRWFNDRGDYTHNITYDLNENSIIMDLGGYTGVWVQQMIEKYSPNVYILEPVPSFYDGMVSKFKNNPKVRLLNAGVGIEDREGIIYMSGDGSSSNLTNGDKINVKFTEQKIHYDDSISTIKIKIVNEFEKDLRKKISLDEIYMFCQKKKH